MNMSRDQGEGVWPDAAMKTCSSSNDKLARGLAKTALAASALANPDSWLG